ncbi:tetratricopeptide repeat protein [bacterium]|nr:tetratricopeptide repeat protein [bacterium]
MKRHLWVVLFAPLLMLACQSKEMTSAKVYIQEHNFDAALEQLKIEIENNPANAEAHFLLGQIYAEKDSFELMLIEFNKAAELDSSLIPKIEKWKDSKYSDAINKGISYGKKEEFEKAFEYTLIAEKIKPDGIEAHKNLAYFYSKLGDDEKALEESEKAFALDTTDVQQGLILASEYLASGDTTHARKAIDVLNKLTSTEPKNPTVHKFLARAYAALGEIELTVKNMDEALEYTPNTDTLKPNLAFEFGIIAFQIQRFDKGEEYFRIAKQLNPDMTEAHYNLAICLERQEKYSEAEPVLWELINKDITNHSAWQEFAITLQKNGKTDAAKVAYKLSQALEEKNTERAKKLIEKFAQTSKEYSSISDKKDSISFQE